MRRGILPALLALTLVSASGPEPASRAVAGHGVIRGDLGTGRGDALQVARDTLDRFADRLGAGAASFELDSVRRSIIGTHVRGSEVRGGVPVEGTSAAVHIIDGRVVQVEARPSRLPGSAVSTPIRPSVALGRALAHVGVRSPEVPARVERILTPHRGRLVDVWRVSIFSLSPAVAADVDVSSADGGVLTVHDATLHVDGTAKVFDPNPVVTLKDNSLREPGVDQAGVDTDLDSPTLTSARVTLPIRSYELEPVLAGMLVGPYVEVHGPAPLDVDGTFEYTRGDPRFETTMAYAHIDRFQRYAQRLGFVGDAAINAEPQDTYTLPVLGFDNSFYQPGNDLLLFGAGGVDDAEDAEVILHELGHAIHHDQVPGWGARHEGGAMGEGFGDFLAAAYYAGSLSGGFQDTCIMDWDAVSYSSAKPPCLRRLDTGKIYPKDMRNQVHADGEIWSGFLWNLRSKLGCTEADASPECVNSSIQESQVKSDRVLKLVLASHELLTPTAQFRDAVAALITAADALGHPEWVPLITASAQQFGLPLS